MLEFDGRLRLYYAFRPKFCRGQLPALLQRVGLDASDVDALVCNACATDGLDDPKTLRRLNNASKTPCGDRPQGAIVLDFDPVRGLLESQMRRDAGGPIYKVRNKRYSNDVHACMPGLPDDEADLLFAILATSQRVETSPTYAVHEWDESGIYGGAVT